jgi:hypothetical protein
MTEQDAVFEVLTVLIYNQGQPALLCIAARKLGGS